MPLYFASKKSSSWALPKNSLYRRLRLLRRAGGEAAGAWRYGAEPVTNGQSV